MNVKLIILLCKSEIIFENGYVFVFVMINLTLTYDIHSLCRFFLNFIKMLKIQT